MGAFGFFFSIADNSCGGVALFTNLLNEFNSVFGHFYVTPKLFFIDRNAIAIKPGFEDFVFISKRGKNISRIMVFHIIKELADKIGLIKNISPHTFRHSFATHLLEGGANLRAIQAMLGHESIGTTEIYTHIDRNMLRSEIIEHHPRNIKFREKH